MRVYLMTYANSIFSFRCSHTLGVEERHVSKCSRDNGKYCPVWGATLHSFTAETRKIALGYGPRQGDRGEGRHAG